MPGVRPIVFRVGRGLRPPSLTRSVYERVLGTEAEIQIVADNRP